jgi:hypothetical protein
VAAQPEPPVLPETEEVPQPEPLLKSELANEETPQTEGESVTEGPAEAVREFVEATLSPPSTEGKPSKCPLPPPKGDWVSGEALDAEMVFSDEPLPESPPSNLPERGSPILDFQIPLDEKDLEEFSEAGVLGLTLGVSDAVEIAVIETALDETDLEDLSAGNIIEGEAIYRLFQPNPRCDDNQQIPAVTITITLEEEEEEIYESSISLEDTEVQGACCGNEIVEKENSEEDVVVVDVGIAFEPSGLH